MPRAFVGLLLVGVLAAALLLDGSGVLGRIGVSGSFDRDIQQLVVPEAYSIPVSSPEISTWFCPGGSSPGGRADVSLEIVNASVEPAQAIVSGIRSGPGIAPTDAVVMIEAGRRTRVRLSDLVTDSAWMAAVVEVDSPDVIVEQTYLGVARTTDRALCHSRTSDLWVVASGATRFATRGEEMVLLLLNPFPHDAVLNVRFNSDVGVDTLNGVVVPARRVVALNVNMEVPAAGRVSAVIDVVVGQIAASRVQSLGLESLADHGEPVGLSVTPLASTTAPVWHLLDLNSSDRDDVVSVVNPSADQTAEVDLEIIADAELQYDPIELTIRPGALSQIHLGELSRLAGLASYSITARSLTGLPIAVMHESRALSIEDQDDGGGEVSVAATTGLDVSSTRWLAPLGSGSHRIGILNPSPGSVAIADLAVLDGQDRKLITEIEIAPLQRVSISASELGAERPIVEVVSGSPVVVSRDLSGVSQHQLLPGVVAAESLPATVP